MFVKQALYAQSHLPSSKFDFQQPEMWSYIIPTNKNTVSRLVYSCTEGLLVNKKVWLMGKYMQ